MKQDTKQFRGLWISKSPVKYKEDASDYYNDNPNTLIRKAFNLNKGSEKYNLNIGCLGYYIAYINGKRIADYELNSDWTQYDKTIYYDKYDITNLLVDGENIIAIELGNGMYNPSPLRLFGKYNLREKLRVVGEPCIIGNICNSQGENIISTDETWKVENGPLLFNNLYLGERIDNRLYDKKWNEISFNDDNWSKAIIDNSKKGELILSYIPKIRRKRKLKPTSIIENSKGNLLVDFTETLSGVIDISFKGLDGKKIKLIYAENVNDDNESDCISTLVGHVGMYLKEADITFTGGAGAPKIASQQDEIISRDGINEYTNKFTYHSFRYVEISGLSKEDLISIEATYIYSDVDIVGNIKTSNEYLNKLYDISEKTKLNNFHSIFEDCARERLGYGGDIVALAPSNLYMFDLAKLYKKVMIDFRQDQTENGGIPETAPYMGIQSNGTGEGEGPILWQFVYPYIVYKCYQYYGDKELLVNEYEYLKKQMNYLISLGIDVLEEKCLGDHGSPETYKNFKVGTPDKKLVAHCTYALFLKYNIYFAKLMNDSIYEKYEEELINLKRIINEKFKNEDGSYADKTQTGYAFVIFSEVCEKPEELIKLFVDKIGMDNYHLKSGIFGLMMTYDVLNQYRYDEIIEKWLMKNDFPSIGYMLECGKTALSEQFNMENCSHNHAMLSSYTSWYYEGLAGIKVLNEAEGANKIILKPYFSELIDSFECTFKSHSGEIKSSWTRHDDRIVWNFTIPKELEKCQIVVLDKYITLQTNYIEGNNGDFYMILKNK